MFIKKNDKGVSLVLVALGLASLLGFAALAVDMGNAFNVQNELQKATTTSVLAGASAFNPNASDTANSATIKSAVEESFKIAKADEPSLSSAQIIGSVQVDPIIGAVRVQTKADAPTYFIGIIGIRSLEVNSKAAAINYSSAYKVMNDLSPMPAANQKPLVVFPETISKIGPSQPPQVYNIGPSSANDRIVLAGILPITNGVGPEVSVVEVGDLDGYEVLVSSKAAGPWYTITSTGKGLDGGSPALTSQSFPASKGYDANRKRFFGSGSFDLEGTGIENARYIQVRDDGVEDGSLSTAKGTLLTEAQYPVQSADSKWVPAGALNSGGMNLGRGADIDGILVHQHAISVNYDDLGTDTNGDGIINAYEILFGDYANPGKSVSDNANTPSVLPTPTPAGTS